MTMTTTSKAEKYISEYLDGEYRGNKGQVLLDCLLKATDELTDYVRDEKCNQKGYDQRQELIEELYEMVSETIDGKPGHVMVEVPLPRLWGKNNEFFVCVLQDPDDQDICYYPNNNNFGCKKNKIPDSSWCPLLKEANI